MITLDFKEILLIVLGVINAFTLLLSIIAPRTKTTIDDKILKFLSKLAIHVEYEEDKSDETNTKKDA